VTQLGQIRLGNATTGMTFNSCILSVSFFWYAGQSTKDVFWIAPMSV
jgi:hypothetical protein